jgi:hypothetical protein
MAKVEQATSMYWVEQCDKNNSNGDMEEGKNVSVINSMVNMM